MESYSPTSVRKNWVFTAGYVGTHAYRLWNHESSDLNQATQPLDSNFSGPAPADCLSNNYGRPYFNQQPCLVSILPLDYAQLHTMYNAFQTSINKQFSNGFNMLVSYTFGKNLGMPTGMWEPTSRIRMIQTRNTGQRLRTFGNDCPSAPIRTPVSARPSLHE